MENENIKGRKEIIKKIGIVFIVIMLLLTFFSNTIMNYSLPEVATEPVSSGTVSNKVRGQGTVETNADYDIVVSGSRVIKEVKVEDGDIVKKGQVLFTFEDGENTELEQEEETLAQMELDYAKSLLKLGPDYSNDNDEIKEAKAELQTAIKEQEAAKTNDKELKKAKSDEAAAKKAVEEQQKKIDGLQEKIDAYGEVGDYEAAAAQAAELSRTLEKAKVELSDLKEDLKAAENKGDDTTDIKRGIRDKELEISNTELDLATAQKTADNLKGVSGSYNQLKSDMAAADKSLKALQDALSKKSEKVEELSKTPALEDAKKAVKEKQKTLSALLKGLNTKKKEDALSQQAEDMDNASAVEKIEKQKEKIEKMKKGEDLYDVKAKEDGVISGISCKEGDTVNADMALAKLQLDESGYVVRVTVSKAQSKLIAVGNEATVENIWDSDVVATVKSIKADTENPNQNMVITYEVKGNVQPGQTLTLSAGERSNRYETVVPNNAIKEDSKGKFVLVVTVKGTPLGNRYKVKRADVEVLASDDTASGVQGAVYEYDNVVTNASKPLESGMQVRLVE